MLQGALPGQVIRGAGDTFEMKMYFAELGDYHMINHVVEYGVDAGHQDGRAGPGRGTRRRNLGASARPAGANDGPLRQRRHRMAQAGRELSLVTLRLFRRVLGPALHRSASSLTASLAR